MDRPESAVHGWITFRDADFGSPEGSAATTAAGPAVGTFTARVGRTEPGSGRLEVRRGDALSGPVIATLEVPSTGGRYHWIDVSAPIELAAGVDHLHLVMLGRQRLDTFRIDLPGQHA